MKTIIWLRKDLRIFDNKLLQFDNKEALLIFTFDEFLNNNQKEFLIYQVLLLKQDLKKINLDIALFEGKTDEIFEYLRSLEFDHIVTSMDYNIKFLSTINRLKKKFNVELINNNYLFLKDDIKTRDNGIFKVFSYFYKAAVPMLGTFNYSKLQIRKAQFNYEFIYVVKDKSIEAKTIYKNSIDLGIYKLSPKQIIKRFFKYYCSNYEKNRDYPVLDATSRFSAYINFGLVSIREITHLAIINKASAFLRQIIFREFFANFYGNFPQYQIKDFKPINFLKNENEQLENFFNANTGIAIIDAGVREILTTGYMHNRVRMIVASFLTKDLMTYWKVGEKFFANHLIDYDSINNIASWQWVCGVGLDNRPIRIFNPYLQCKKFDNECKYIKKFIPELKNIDCNKLCDEQLSSVYYKAPIVSHKKSSSTFMELFKSCK